MAAAVAFWLTLLAMAMAAWPIAARVFRRFPDAGAGLAPALASVLLGLGYFWLRLVKVLPSGPGGAALALILLGAVSVVLARYDRRFVTTTRRSTYPALVMVALFTVAFFGFAWVRSYMADVRGTEQPMDLMYVNAIVNADDFPPEDPWFAGEPVSYYYLGYIEAAIPTMISGVGAGTGYNLALAGLFASSLTAAASIAVAAARWALPHRRREVAPLAGAMAVLLLLFAGSLSTWFHFASAHGAYSDGIYRLFSLRAIGPCNEIGPQLAQENLCHMGTASWYPDKFWWWFQTSRVIPETITEFPAFSFLLGDLHPHVMSIPGVLLAIGAALALYRGWRSLELDRLLRAPVVAAVLACVMAGLAFVNTWDVITFWCLIALAVVARNMRHAPPGRAIVDAASYLIPVTAVAAVLLVPWLVTFSSQAGGMRAYTGAGSTPGELLIQWGPLLALSVAFCGWTMTRPGFRADATAALIAALVLAVLAILWATATAIQGEFGAAIDARGAWGWLSLAILALLVWALAVSSVAAWRTRLAIAPAGTLLGLGVLLLLGAELFLVKDVFFASSPRLNTIFKLSYQGWILLSVGGGVVTALAIGTRANRRTALALAVPGVLLGLAALAYMPLVVPERSNGFDNPTTVDGLAWVERTDPGEAMLVDWVRNNVDRGVVILETPGQSYTETGRISGRTGRPTVLGWRGHELQWRGGLDDAALDAQLQQREQDADRVYIDASADAIRTVAERYGVEYVVVGRQELTKYGADVGQRLGQVLDTIFETGEYRIFRVPDEARNSS